jgi:ketosteroid isomerase-like protein
VTRSSNLDLVRSIRAAWERGDYGSADWAHPEIEYVTADGPSPGSWSGLAGMVEGSRDLFDVWEELRSEAQEYRELDAERVFVLLSYSGRGKASGLDIRHLRTRGAELFYIRDGKVTKFVHYFDRERAIADLGLAPEATTPDS